MTTDKRRAAIWMRVSTIEQETANQRPVLEREAEKQDLRIVRRWDFTASAYKGEQEKELEQLCTAAEAHDFDVLIIWALDRLERRGISATLKVMERLWASGLRVVSVQESWLDQDTPMRPIQLAMLAWAANYEAKRKEDRVALARQRLLAQGKNLGRPKGKKDTKTRRRSPYVLRWDKAREDAELAGGHVGRGAKIILPGTGSGKTGE